MDAPAGLGAVEAEASLRAVLEAIPDLIFRIRRDGTYLAFHCHPADPLWVPPERIVGRTLGEVLPTNLAALWTNYLREALDSGLTQVDEYRLATPRGERCFEGRIAASGPDEVVAIVRDVTERRRDEEALRELNLTLERRVRERTAELEARNAEQETFVYTVSHDLRQPLLAIQGMGTLLTEAVEAADAGEATFLAARVVENADKMGNLLSDLLAFSRAGREMEPRQAVDLGDAVRSVLAELVSGPHPWEVAVDLPSTWPVVLYPPSEAYQVLSNLLGNAAKFAGRQPPDGPAEAPRLAVGWTIGDGKVVLTVSDNGPGVPPPYREKVFALFQKLDPHAEGTGVGLAIVKRIVERYGGRVWVEDSPPPPEGLGGAAFKATLPLERRATARPPS